MNIIGLTGGIATGKSTVSQFLESLHINVIDADVINHHLLMPTQAGYNKVLQLFPNTPLLSDNFLDKKYLREIIFNDKHSKTALEQQLHPLIKAEIISRIETLQASINIPYCIVSVPLLIEANFKSLVNDIWVCDCSENTQIQRLMKRDHISQADAQIIISHQLERQERLRYANEIINTEHIDSMQKQIMALHNQQIKLHSN